MIAQMGRGERCGQGALLRQKHVLSGGGRGPGPDLSPMAIPPHSRLFEPLLPLYTPHFRCVLLDFLGNGRSDRVESFPADLWQEEARQALALIRAFVGHLAEKE